MSSRRDRRRKKGSRNRSNKKNQEEKKRQVLGAAGSVTQEETQEQEKYLELHKYLKELRKFVLAEGKKDPTLKSTIGDYRRGITKCIGQLREGQGTAANRGQVCLPPQLITVSMSSSDHIIGNRDSRHSS